jgi:hypothetical protein
MNIPPEKRIQLGEVRNPKGRPPLSDCFSDITRELLATNNIDISYTVPVNSKSNRLMTKHLKIDSGNKPINHAIASALICECLRGNVKAIHELMERTYGKAKMFISHSNDGDKFDFASKTDEELKNIISGTQVVIQESLDDKSQTQ